MSRHNQLGSFDKSGPVADHRSHRNAVKTTSRKALDYLEAGVEVVTLPLWAPYALWKVYRAAFDR